MTQPYTVVVFAGGPKPDGRVADAIPPGSLVVAADSVFAVVFNILGV